MENPVQWLTDRSAHALKSTEPGENHLIRRERKARRCSRRIMECSHKGSLALRLRQLCLLFRSSSIKLHFLHKRPISLVGEQNRSLCRTHHGPHGFAGRRPVSGRAAAGRPAWSNVASPGLGIRAVSGHAIRHGKPVRRNKPGSALWEGMGPRSHFRMSQKYGTPGRERNFTLKFLSRPTA